MKKNNNVGPLQYMSGRLIWLQDLSSKIVIGDLNGNNTYQLSSPNQLPVSWFIPTYTPHLRTLFSLMVNTFQFILSI